MKTLFDKLISTDSNLPTDFIYSTLVKLYFQLDTPPNYLHIADAANSLLSALKRIQTALSVQKFPESLNKDFDFLIANLQTSYQVS